jgi:hypothetical protein
MLRPRLHRLVALLLLAVCGLAAMAPGGRPLTFCLALGDDHHHVLFAAPDAERIVHSHDSCCPSHEHEVPAVPAGNATLCMHDDEVCAEALCEPHSHACVDISVSAGDATSASRKAVEASDAAITPPAIPLLPASSAPARLISIQAIGVIGWSPPALLRSTILIL